MTSVTQLSLTTPAALEAAGLVADARALAPVAARYAVSLTPTVAGLIDPSDAADPIARQYVPSPAELTVLSEELADPIGDARYSPVKGLVHRHADRVLFKVTGVCPVYCRFCFRREMVGPQKAEALRASEVDAAFAYIAAHPEIWEVILTGGDPFALSARRARDLTERLDAIAHVRVIRWHTRVPVADPARVTDEFARAIAPKRARLVVAIHANHPRELTDEARAVFARLAEAGAMLVSQSVLLKGVNDDAETLAALMRGFVEAGVKPYYLHHPDLAPGTSHFRVSVAEGQALMRRLRTRISGIAMPTYVLDIPGGEQKALASESDVLVDDDGVAVRDSLGAWRRTEHE